MDFIGSNTWRILALATALAVLVHQFGLRGNGELSPSLSFVGEIGRVALVFLALWLTGWQGAVGIGVLAWAVAPVLADMLLYPVLRKGTRTTFGDFRSTVPWRPFTIDAAQVKVENLMKQWDREDREYAEIAKRPDVARVLGDYGKEPEEIARVARELARDGLGVRIPRKIITDPNLLAQHFELEAKGIVGMKRVSIYLQQFGHVT